jgi:sterol desaturase/sphingolipid hydroxylase (fatty acid hydroxylase superfamily)
LSVWDYSFGTAFVPKDGRDIELGFEDVEQYPKSFWEQQWQPFRKEIDKPKPELPTEVPARPPKVIIKA